MELDPTNNSHRHSGGNAASDLTFDAASSNAPLQGKSVATGGNGGNGGAGLIASGAGYAEGGAGAASTLVNALSGSSRGGYLTLMQTANGGSGGGAEGLTGVTGGNGGAASSNLSFNDNTANPIQAAILTGTSTANGGAGGAAPISGQGGDATSIISLTGAHAVNANANAVSSSDNGQDLAPGSASASAIAIATQSGRLGAAIATAAAGSGPSAPGTVIANADASATANAVDGNEATANASVSPAYSATLTTTAVTTGTGVVSQITPATSTQATQPDNAEQASSIADISGNAFGFDGSQDNYAYATGLPSASQVADQFAGNNAVALAFENADLLATGWQGSRYQGSVSGSQTYTTRTSFTVDGTGLSGKLISSAAEGFSNSHSDLFAGIAPPQPIAGPILPPLHADFVVPEPNIFGAIPSDTASSASISALLAGAHSHAV